MDDPVPQTQRQDLHTMTTTSYVLEIDFEWREVSTQTDTFFPATEEDARKLIEQQSKMGKYEGYRLYKVTKELIESK